MCVKKQEPVRAVTEDECFLLWWQIADVCVQELCREIHHKIDVIDEERYDLEMKVNKSNKEVDSAEPAVDLSSEPPALLPNIVQTHRTFF